jgi:ribosomal protein S18 acetylase RimI-like enzyme
MSQTELQIRPFVNADETAVLALWNRCGLIVPQNNPQQDIAAKRQCQPDLFLVGTLSNALVATAMAGYDGHRGWIYYLAVEPAHRRKGIGRKLINHVIAALRQRGCQKLNLQVRASNPGVLEFYRGLGFTDDDVISLGMRL